MLSGLSKIWTDRKCQTAQQALRNPYGTLLASPFVWSDEVIGRISLDKIRWLASIPGTRIAMTSNSTNALQLPKSLTLDDVVAVANMFECISVEHEVELPLVTEDVCDRIASHVLWLHDNGGA